MEENLRFDEMEPMRTDISLSACTPNSSSVISFGQFLEKFNFSIVFEIFVEKTNKELYFVEYF